MRPQKQGRVSTLICPVKNLYIWDRKLHSHASTDIKRIYIKKKKNSFFKKSPYVTHYNLLHHDFCFSLCLSQMNETVCQYLEFSSMHQTFSIAENIF